MIKENIDIEELIEMHEKNNAKFLRMEFDGTEFYTHQLKFLHHIITSNKNIQYHLKVIFKYKASRRIALIVLLEEDFYNIDEYNNVNLDKYEAKAKERFDIGQSSKVDLDTPTKIHPKNPCIYFRPDNMTLKKYQYKNSLEKILETPFHYFDIKAIIPLESLTKNYHKFKDCY